MYYTEETTYRLLCDVFCKSTPASHGNRKALVKQYFKGKPRYSSKSNANDEAAQASLSNPEQKNLVLVLDQVDHLGDICGVGDRFIREMIRFCQANRGLYVITIGPDALWKTFSEELGNKVTCLNFERYTYGELDLICQ